MEKYKKAENQREFVEVLQRGCLSLRIVGWWKLKHRILTLAGIPVHRASHGALCSIRIFLEEYEKFFDSLGVDDLEYSDVLSTQRAWETINGDCKRWIEKHAPLLYSRLLDDRHVCWVHPQLEALARVLKKAAEEAGG